MYEELLRIQNGFYNKEQINYLHDFEMTIPKSSFIGLFPISKHGLLAFKNILVDEEKLSEGKVYWETVENRFLARGNISWVGKGTKLFESMNITELFFIIKRGKSFIINMKNLEQKTLEVLKSHHIAADPKDMIHSLATAKRVQIEILTRVLHGNKLIVLDEVEKIMNSQELKSFISFCSNLQKQGISFLYIGNPSDKLFKCCSKLYLMDKGRIVRLLDNSKIDSVLPAYVTETINPLINAEETFSNKSLASFPDLPYFWKQGLNINLVRGKCVSFICENYTAMEEFVQYFSHSPAFLNRMNGLKFQLLPETPITSTLFSGQSFLFNLTVIAEKKMNQKIFSKKFFNNLKDEFPDFLLAELQSKNIDDLDMRQQYNLIYLKILINRPDVVILVQPLLSKDMNIQNHILDLIQILKKYNISVIVLTLNKYRWSEFSDAIYEAKEIAI